MKKYASKVVEQAKEWLGRKESNGSHKEIIDVYNSHKPLARGYKVQYSDSWCATFVSAVAIKLKYTDIIPTECGCNQMIALFKKMGAWVENDARKPQIGDIIFYDWDDSGNGEGENVGSSDHVGIVEAVNGDTIHVIEGNYSDSVNRRYLRVNGKYIRGYGVPKYDAISEIAPNTNSTSKGENTVNIKLNVLKKGDKCAEVYALQAMLNSFIDVKLIVDGEFGSQTEAAVKRYQRLRGLTADGIVGEQTWTQLLKK